MVAVVSHKTRLTMDALAELVANGSTISGAGLTLGLTQSYADQLWQRIKRELGAQAV